MEWLKTLVHVISPTGYGADVTRLHRKLVVMERELEQLESAHDANGNGSESSERIAKLRSSIAESKAKIASFA